MTDDQLKNMTELIPDEEYMLTGAVISSMARELLRLRHRQHPSYCVCDKCKTTEDTKHEL